MIVGSFLHVFGLMMASISTEYYQILLSQGVCSAIGAASIFQGGTQSDISIKLEDQLTLVKPAALACIGGWFDKKRGAAYGIAVTGGSVGGVIFPVMVSRLIDKIGFPWMMRVCAFLILVLLVVATLAVKVRQSPKAKIASRDQLVQPFKEFSFVAVMIGIFFFNFGYFVPITYLVVQARAAGMHPSLARYLVPILNAAR